MTSVNRRDVEKFHHDVAEGKTASRSRTKAGGVARVRGGQTAANMAVGLLARRDIHVRPYGRRCDLTIQCAAWRSTRIESVNVGFRMANTPNLAGL